MSWRVVSWDADGEPLTRTNDGPKPWIDVEEKTIRKRGAKYRIAREVEAIQFVATHTSLPVPRILEHRLVDDNKPSSSWMLMEKLPGTELAKAWEKMSSDAQATTIKELKAYFEELHTLRPPVEENTQEGEAVPAAWIGSVSKGPCYDHRITNLHEVGPFPSIKEFHDLLVEPVGNVSSEEQARYRALLPDEDEIVFVNADVHGENILVDPETGRVTGIIDWEFAGFWPRWWEYRKAMCCARRETWWFPLVKQVFVHSCYPEATEADEELEYF